MDLPPHPLTALIEALDFARQLESELAALRDKTIEECALVCDEIENASDSYGDGCADAIRALKNDTAIELCDALERIVGLEHQRDELLAALEEVIHDVEEGAPEHAVSRARAAIKKARGEK